MPSHQDTLRDAAAKLAEAQRDLDAAVTAALNDGVRQTVIAETTGVSRQTIYHRYVRPHEGAVRHRRERASS